MLTCYIIDDEQHAVDALSAMLKKKFEQQVAICGSNIKATIAIVEIENLKPDIVFLDVEMPEMNGLELLKHFPNRSFHVIFTTAHEKYALPALKAAATDYLVKPLSPQDVYEAIQKCITKETENGLNKEPQRLSLHSTHGVSLINVADIIRIEADNNYSHFYLKNQPKIIVSKTLKEFEDQLINQHFFRVHQSHLINLNHLLSVHSKDGDYALLIQNHKVEISRRRKPELMLRLKKV